MAQSLERLTRRTGTMRSIRGIVRTMKTISAINALPYEDAARAIADYRATILDGLHAFVAACGPLATETDTTRSRTIIAFGTDHGLCGNYNEMVATEVLHAATADALPRVICVGAKLEDALAGHGIAPNRALLPPANVDGLGRLAGRLITLIDDLRGAGDDAGTSVSLAFMRRAGHGRQSPVTRSLLPLDKDRIDEMAGRRWNSRTLPGFGLPPQQLLAALVRNFLFAEIYAAAAEAMVTENAARLARMQQAERAIDDRLEGLTGEMRQVRQSDITTELLDVVIGFETLRKDAARRIRKLRRCASGQAGSCRAP